MGFGIWFLLAKLVIAVQRENLIQHHIQSMSNVYLNETIEQFPDRPALAAEIQAAGFDQVSARGLTFGIVALHEARAGAAPGKEV